MALAKPGLRVGVVGATGMVGQELLSLLERRRFPVASLAAFSSGKTGRAVRFGSKTLPAPAPTAKALGACELIFFVSADEVSARWAPRLAAQGCWVIDDSSAFRLDPKVPLVIPEVNGDALRRDRRLIAGPNCTMTGLAVAALPLHRAARVRAVRVASYQAVSGAGKAALDEFFSQARGLSASLSLDGGRAPVLAPQRASVLPRAIAGNVVPQVGGFDAMGYSSEENKVAAELRKIWSAPNLLVSATTVRVPVVRGHSLAAWLSLGKPLSAGAARRLLSKAEGLVVSEDGAYPTPLECAGRHPVYAGRLRQGVDARELCLWIVSDNLLKGAALNSVQIAEELLKRRWLSL